MSILPLHIIYFFHYIRTNFLLFTSYFLAILKPIESISCHTSYFEKAYFFYIFNLFFYFTLFDWAIFLNGNIVKK